MVLYTPTFPPVKLKIENLSGVRDKTRSNIRLAAGGWRRDDEVRRLKRDRRPDRGEAASMWFGKGAVVGVVATFPLAALCALVFRFPIPLGGYLSGPGAIVPALIGVLFYGVLFGGFIVQALAGGVGGLLAEYIGAPDKGRIARLCIVFSSIGASIGVIALAMLDKIIGPW